MNVARLFLSLVAGLAATLIAFSAVYVRGDLGGVFRYLHERGNLKRLVAAGAGPEQVAAAKARAQEVAQSVADPLLATRLMPLEVLLGVLAGLAVWWFFGQRAARAAGESRPDLQERMVLRFAHRHGGRFTLRDLSTRSPLSAQQAREVTGRMLEAGQLCREGELLCLP